VLRGAGLPVPELLAELHRTGRACLIWEFVNGTTGASLMDGDQARSLAGAMGRAQGEIQAIRDAAIPVDEAWRGPHDLRVAARRWQAAAGTTDTASALRAIVDRIAEQEWTPVVTHGDFVPANVLVADGDISAILDLGDVAMRHPLVDAAWWSLIVAHHHGSDHHHLETAYLAAAGLPTTSEERRRLADVAAIRALQLAAAQSSGPPIRRLLAAAIGRAARPAGAEGHSATHSSPGE
jgi:aminoglycoside phosphotransferase (APT) family kinase protein